MTVEDDVDVDGDSTGERVVGIRGDPDHELTRGYTCAKGRALPAWHHHPRRLDHPMVRRHGRLEPVSWEECLDDLAARLSEIRDAGAPDAIAAFLGYAVGFDANGRRFSERFLHALGSRSRYTTTTVDMPCKLLVPELMAGTPYLVPQVDHDRADLVLIFGSNVVVSHGHFVMWPDPVRRLRAIAERGEVWAVDPRVTETTRAATRHLSARAGTDYALLAHLVRELLADGADREFLRAHARGVEELGAAVAPFDLSRTVALTGLAEADVLELLAAIRRHGRFAGHTGTGVTMAPQGNVAEWLLWSLHAITGSLDRPGGLWFNPGLLLAFDQRAPIRSNGDPEPGPASRPELPGRWGEMPCAALADEIETGNVRALVVVGGNPVVALPERKRMEAALAQLDVLAVSGVLDDETVALATHVLPAAGQLERADLTYFVDQFQPAIAAQYTTGVVAASGDRRPVWWQLAQVAQRMGLELLPAGMDPDVCTDDDLLAAAAGRGGTTFGALQAAESGLVDRGAVFGWVTDALPDGRWNLAPHPLVEQLGALGAPAPLVLVPRRQPRHMNSQLTDLDRPGIARDHPELLVHPSDAAAAGIVDGDVVVISSATGSVQARASVGDRIARGVVSLPHGWGSAGVGHLTTGRDGLDPLTAMVLQSTVPVRLAPVDEDPA